MVTEKRFFNSIRTVREFYDRITRQEKSDERSPDLVTVLDENGDVKKTSQFLSSRDKSLIGHWLAEDSKVRAFNRRYRLDLSDFIYIFSLYHCSDGVVLSGRMVPRTAQDRARLLDLQSKFLAAEGY